MKYEIDGLVFYYPDSPQNTFNWTNKNIIDGVIKDKTYGDSFEGVVVDIGANIGSFTVLAAETAKKVIAYEPSKENFRFLKKNVRMNFLSNVKLINEGVGEPGLRILRTNSVNCGAYSLFKTSTSNIGKEVVKIVSLSDVFQENKLKLIDFLKIDAEGAEFEFLFEDNDLLSKVKKIAMEVHFYKPEWTEELMKGMLENMGFQVRIERALVDTAKTFYATRI